jgi:transposase
MTRVYGRRADGRRIHEATPGTHWKILTILGAMRLRGIVAAMTIEEATDADIFLAYVEDILCPTLEIGDVVVMDNLSSHKVSRVSELIAVRGAEVLYLPPYSPDLNPIEKAWSKIKQYLRSTRARRRRTSTAPLPKPSNSSLQIMPRLGSGTPYQHYSNCRNALMKASSTRFGVAFSTGLFLILSLAHGQSLANANNPAPGPIEYSTLQQISGDDSSAAIAEKAAKVLPRPNQTAWMRLERTFFIHFGPNTFRGVEWGNGREDPSVFNPTELDADQWVRAIKEAGGKMVVLVCKHHDGLSLWPTRYSNHSVAASPWRGGMG